MASNLDLNVIISASFEKLKKGMADAVSVVKGSTKKMEDAAAGSKKALEDALGGKNLRVKRRALSHDINAAKADIQGLENELKTLQSQLADTGKFDFRAQAKLKGQITSTKQQLKDLNIELGIYKDQFQDANLAIQDGSQKAEQNTQAMEALSRAVNAASMATLLLSGNNETMGKVMRGVQVTMALASAAVAVYNLSQRQNEILTLASAKAQAVFTWAVGASTGALKVFRVALLATGIGAAIVLVSALAGAFDDTTEAVDELDKKLEENKKTLESSARFASIYADFVGEKAIADLKRRGATDKEIFDQEQSNLKARINLLKQEADAKHNLNEDVRSMRAEIYKLELEYENNKTKFTDEQEAKRLEKSKEGAKELAKLNKERAALEEKMQANLTQFLIDEEVKRVKERGKAREMTEADLMPAAPAAAPKTDNYLMAIAQLNEEAAALDMEALAQWRANNADLFLAMEIRARKMQQFAVKMEVAAEQASAALATMSASMLESFAVLLGDAITGKADAMQTFLQSFASSLAGFLGTFGKALIAQGIAIDAFKESLKSLDPAVAIVAGLGLLTASTLVKNAMAKGSQVQAFADGGIVSGPTLGLMGEYPGARSNPEVIAPLDKLQSMINTGGGSGELVASTKFDGRDLWLAVNRYDKDRARG